MEKNFKFYVQGGGVFSRLLQCAIQPLSRIDFDNVYLSAYPIELYKEPEYNWIRESFDQQISEMNRYGISDPYDYLLDYVLDQQSDYTYQNGGILDIGNLYTKYQPIEKSPNFQRYKEVAAKLKFKNSLYSSSYDLFKGIETDQVLAVHLRIKDIDGHGNDVVFLDNYIAAITQAMQIYNYKKIFVAADNIVSLNRLKNIFGDLIIHHEFPRSEVEVNDFSRWELINYFKQYYWQTAVVDCMSLSKCRNLICRTSNFSNAAIVFGNYAEIYRL